MAQPLDLNADSLAYVERLYATFLEDASRVPEAWRRCFEELPHGETEAGGRRDGSARFAPSFRPHSVFNPSREWDGFRAGGDIELARLQERVDQLIRNYRVRGHMVARIDPLGAPRPDQPELDPKFYGFSETQFDTVFSTAALPGENQQTLGELLSRLRNTYCRWIGVQFMHIDELGIREWLQHRMEGRENRIRIPRERQLRILTRLTDAVIFEEFIRKKYVGAKSFSLEGAESLIPLLDLAIEKAGEQGIREIVLGMAHRGRLNVLANILGKSPQQIFREFEDVDPEEYRGGGDVKHHLGHSSDWTTAAGHEVHLSLCFNPSHLEFVNPVAVGRMRAKQDRAGDTNREQGLVLLIHGDAGFIGEGVTQETLNLSQLPGYTVGGTLHVIVNNQIGFTTPPDEARSSTYATDVAKMLQIPIFHVNGEHPEAVAQAVDLAMDFRRRFRRDVVIDMYGYRRWGHNEGDEPSFTQPLMYEQIERRPSVRDGYLEHLAELGEITGEDADRIAGECRQRLEAALSEARGDEYRRPAEGPRGVWDGYHGGQEEFQDDVETGVPEKKLRELLERLTDLPDDFHLHRKLRRAWETRRKMAAGDKPLDWSAAEALAFATLASEGHRVRLSGQDSARGTFSQRHAVLHDTEDGHRYELFQQLSPDQAPVETYNSPLSECGVLGFEYGYSLDCPDGLVLWEAQFGDFVNAAQVIIDQFVASAEDKWRRLSGLVLLLPHGFEGQGPEHSSARLERFLTLAAEENLQVVAPTTPAQYFHCLRRQVVRPWRKPLVVLTPKSLLRHGRCISTLEDCARGHFRRVIGDDDVSSDDVRRVLLCSGKVYYDLVQRREEQEHSEVAIVRLEQLYPLQEVQLSQALEGYSAKTPVLWVQEEPVNMGACRYVRARFGDTLPGGFSWSVVARAESASPATGSAAAHALEQQELVDRAFDT